MGAPHLGVLSWPLRNKGRPPACCRRRGCWGRGWHCQAECNQPPSASVPTLRWGIGGGPTWRGGGPRGPSPIQGIASDVLPQTGMGFCRAALEPRRCSDGVGGGEGPACAGGQRWQDPVWHPQWSYLQPGVGWGCCGPCPGPPAPGGLPRPEGPVISCRPCSQGSPGDERGIQPPWPALLGRTDVPCVGSSDGR